MAPNGAVIRRGVFVAATFLAVPIVTLCRDQVSFGVASEYCRLDGLGTSLGKQGRNSVADLAVSGVSGAAIMATE